MYEKKVLDEIREALAEWEKKHQDEFKTETKSEYVSESGIPIKRVYTPLDLAEKGFDYMKDVGLPGEYPYTRGNTATGYRSRLWDITGYSGKPLPEESNKLWRAQVAAGAETISMAYDLPCQLGLDPDNPKAEGEVGRVGASLVTQKDWEIAFDGIDFGKIGVYQVFNAPAIVGLANHIVLAEKRGIGPGELRGIQQNDTLKEYISRGNYIFSPTHSIRLVADILSYVGKYMPRYQATTVSGYHPSERGANNIHQLAIALADAFAFIQAAVDRGADIDQIAPGVMFFPCNRHWSFFEDIAMYRAHRRIYAKVLRERFKAKKPESVQCRIYAAQAGTSLYREQYLNNISRIALACLAPALCGCELIDSRVYDEQFGIPTVEASVASVRQQNIVKYEMGIDYTVDPLAGSYFIETLTSETEERVWQVLEDFDKRGGIVHCIETGYAQRLVALDAYDYQRRFESGEIKRVGVNIFQSAEGEEEKPVRIYRADPGVEAKRREAVAEMKKKRDNAKVKKALDEITALAQEEATAENNLVPSVIEATKEYATVGEVCDALRKAWGGYREPSIF